MRPSLHDPESFWCHHHSHGTNLMVIVDHLCRFRHIQVGFPGSASDSRIQGNLRVFQQPELYFSADEYIIADAGFTNDEHVVTMYRRLAELSGEHPEAAYFNPNVLPLVIQRPSGAIIIPTNQEQYFSANEYIMADAGFTNGNRVVAMYRRTAELSRNHPEAAYFNPKAARLRVKVECTFGIWKNRFPTMQRSHTCLKDSIAQRRLHARIISSMVLHNPLVTIGDTEEWETEHYHDMFVDDGQWSLRDGDLARKRRLIQQMMRLRGDTLDNHAPY
ncbi:hypothetical protein IAS59_001261 [Cryptococcus gattii]